LYARARAPFLRLGMGMSRHRQGGMAIRTVAGLPALVGAWGKPGTGALLDTAGIWGWDLDALRRPDLAPRQTREVNHSLLGRALCELDDPPIKALFVASNNPAVTCPDHGRVLAGATGPTADLDLDRLLAGGPVKLAVPGDGPATTYFRSDALAARGLPALPEWRPDPAEADAARFPLRLLTGPGHFQHHTVMAGV